MTPNRTSLAVAVVAAVALAAAPSPVFAQRGGGRHGGHSGRGHAVPRGGGHVSPGVAGARHPRAGTGTGGFPHGGYRPYHGGHYKPYHGGYYKPNYGHYRPYFPYAPYASFWFGWPYYGSAWWPYATDAYYPPDYQAPAPSYGYEMGAPPEAETAPPRDTGRPPDSDPPSDAARDYERNTGRVRIDVRPSDASIYVDDEFWGNARETKFVILRAGPHVIELVRPGFVTLRREIDLPRGEAINLVAELERP
jgi:hypothetical protein